MRLLPGLILICVFVGCTSSKSSVTPTPDTVQKEETVLAIDFLQTHPGEQADYLQFITLNWAVARAAAQKEGLVVDYQVISREPNAGRWDVMLLTEYANEAAYAQREEAFAKLFERPELAMKRIDGKGPRDMADFVDGDVKAHFVQVKR